MSDLRADFHTHSTFSDGTFTPSEIVASAAAAGLDVVAITDHDTLTGWRETEAASRNSSVRFLTGVEISTQHQGVDVHVLGYFPEYPSGAIVGALDDKVSIRVERARYILTRLKEFGFDLDLERILSNAGEGSVGRPHIASAMVKQGYATDIDDAFDRYLGRNGSLYVPDDSLETLHAVEMIRSSGGLAVWAHPYYSRADHLLEKFVRNGLSGLEVYQKNHPPEVIPHYLQLAESAQLAVFGGSDWHGKMLSADDDLGDFFVQVAADDIQRFLETGAAFSVRCNAPVPR